MSLRGAKPEAKSATHAKRGFNCKADNAMMDLCGKAQMRVRMRQSHNWHALERPGFSVPECSIGMSVPGRELDPMRSGEGNSGSPIGYCSFLMR